jgi:hypothetical protein
MKMNSAIFKNAKSGDKVRHKRGAIGTVRGHEYSEGGTAKLIVSIGDTSGWTVWRVCDIEVLGKAAIIDADTTDEEKPIPYAPTMIKVFKE